ncbi:FIST C-terminal domain-containing protein [Luteolibacter yonseiensis]|uniref:FIST C-terminal domain-containing protein n=1 Tax=Luteolibacter yonseiensis TaxID=1144680 RepID=A0A934R690_9BACT|nr:FIST N-terminal domain-containing protein [Luteolibacter yonseiensis]MBK1817752.1 FIST C-terminal domain-containing protein [Luteolibacter yonseiensis]
MKLLQTLLLPSLEWKNDHGRLAPADAELVFAFGIREIIESPDIYQELKKRFPAAHIALASTSGNLADQIIDDSGVLCTALRMEKSRTRAEVANLSSHPDLETLCAHLADVLAADDLRHVFVLSDGSSVNGTELSNTFNSKLPPQVTLSGGLAGDGTAFSKTVVGLDSVPTTGTIVAIGFYGNVELAFGSAGGWSGFGPERLVTRSEGNCLHELDGQPALHLYKTYLGSQAAGLPASALRFPLRVSQGENTPFIVRTILSIDEDANTMTFAGDVPEGAKVQLMRASYEDLIDGAQSAAEQAELPGAELVLCVSCVGRRIVLGQRTEEELESVRAAFGDSPVIGGFYSYGELAPSGHQLESQLHNQTMTITSFREV